MARQIAVFMIGAAATAAAQSCPAPMPAANYNETAFASGIWYEIGKIQTFGGAIIQAGCVCTTLTVTPATGNDTAPGDADALNSCRYQTPSGPYRNATSTLQASGAPGHWVESFVPGFPGANYTVVSLADDDSYVVTFDCTQTIFGLNYCVHVLARKPTMNMALFASLILQANAMGLNPQFLPTNMTTQAGCW